MVKSEALQRLLAEKVISFVEAALANENFVYTKAKQAFIRKKGEFEQIICIPHSTASIIYNQEKEAVELLFNCYSSARLAKYEKWYEENLNEKADCSYFGTHIGSFTTLEFEDFTEADFYEPTKAVQFKRAVSAALSGGTQGEVVYLDENAFKEELKRAVAQLDELSSYEGVLAKIEHPLAPVYKNLHVYLGNTEQAVALYKEAYAKCISVLNEKMEDQYLQHFEKLIKNAKKLLSLEFENPFQTSVCKQPGNADKLHLTNDFQYQSKQVFKGKNSKIVAGLFNEKTSDCFFYLENNSFFKLNKEGEIVFELKVEAGSAFKHDLLTGGLQFVQNSNCLVLDRFILKEDNEVVDIEKALKTEIKKKNKVNFFIRSALFQPENQQYILLCSNNYSNTVIACFNKSFEYISEFSITGNPIMIFAPGKWVVTRSAKHVFYNFQGEKVFELDYAHGNDNIELSNRGQHALSFGYATKSDLYDLGTLKSKVLWAHPTFVKNYKELLYNDTHHNFDLSIAAFAPDDSYIVGGGYHGKYVAWKLPKLERFELIPNAPYLPLFEGAEVVELDNMKFLKNRGNSMNHIKFFNGTGHFITRLGDKNLVWDKDFNNTGMLPVKGKIISVSEKYLTFIEDDVFHVYERI